MRVLFVTDLHGSTLVFEKALVAARDFDADVLIVGGDLSGKRLMAIAPNSNGSYATSELYNQKDDTGKTVEVSIPATIAKSELNFHLRRLEGKGWYWHIADRDEIAGLNNDLHALYEINIKKIYDRLYKWADLATKELPEGVLCFWTGGNDDDQELLDLLTATDLGRFVYAENKVMDVYEYQILSLGFSNETPFKTSRELKDRELFDRLKQLADQVSTTEKLILNVHVPPANCGSLDQCVDIKNPSQLVHVGSDAVRTFIENIQPLADFAGHIHEGKGTAKIGRTQVFNPGSDYYAGVLHAYVAVFSGAKISDYVHFIR